jgi:predicted small metal-binding protein
VTQHQRDFLMDAAEESADQICAELGMDPDYELTGSYIRELISTATEECKNSENHGMEKRIRGTMGE